MTVTTPAPVPTDLPRRVRLRRPGHEPEPVGADHIARPVPIPPPRSNLVSPDDGTTPAPDAEPDAEALRRRATTLVRRTIEVLAGRRAPNHLAGVATAEVVRYVAAVRTTGGPGHADRRPGGVNRIHVARPGPDAAEVVAVCRFGTRFRALALRLDRTAQDRTAPDRTAPVRPAPDRAARCRTTPGRPTRPRTTPAATPETPREHDWRLTAVRLL